LAWRWPFTAETCSQNNLIVINAYQLYVCCVLTVHNILYKLDNTQRDGPSQIYNYSNIHLSRSWFPQFILFATGTSILLGANLWEVLLKPWQGSRLALDLCFSDWVPRNPGRQELRETKMRTGGRILLAVINLYVRITTRVAQFDTNHSVTVSTQTNNRCFCPEVSWFYSEASQQSSPWSVDVSGETVSLSISLRLAVDFLHIMYIK